MTRVVLIAIVLLGSVPAAHAADTTAPTILTLTRVLGTTINVITPPAALTARLEISEEASGSGLGNVYVQWNSPSGRQILSKNDYSERPRKSGSVDLQSPLLTIFHEPGTWVISQVGVCDRANNCTYYSEATLDALAPVAQREYEVVNNRAPDTTLPTIGSNSSIQTASASAGSANPASRKFRVNLHMRDTISGVVWGQACFRSPSGTQSNCAYGNPGRPAFDNIETVEGEFYTGTTWETGTWTLYFASVQDIPGNTRHYSDAALLDAKFPGGRTLEVNP